MILRLFLEHQTPAMLAFDDLAKLESRKILTFPGESPFLMTQSSTECGISTWMPTVFPYY